MLGNHISRLLDRLDIVNLLIHDVNRSQMSEWRIFQDMIISHLHRHEYTIPLTGTDFYSTFWILLSFSRKGPDGIQRLTQASVDAPVDFTEEFLVKKAMCSPREKDNKTPFILIGM